jgi:quercetin dioxygenase-like cupin family protein
MVKNPDSGDRASSSLTILGAQDAPATNGEPMQSITADQVPVADNPHGVDVRHLFKRPHVVRYQHTLQPGEAVKPHKAPVDVFFYVLEGTPSIDIEGETATLAPDALVPSAAGHVHAIRNDGEQRARFLVIKTPNPKA